MNSSSKTPTPDHSLPLPVRSPAEPPTTTDEMAALAAFRQLVARYRRAGYEGFTTAFEQRP